MRLLHRLNQYQRLWQPSAGAPQQVTVGELAERCFCSERHVRTLLRQAQEAGWLSWQASSGRGKRGLLSFYKTPERLRNEMMEQALHKGQQQNAQSVFHAWERKLERRQARRLPACTTVCSSHAGNLPG